MGILDHIKREPFWEIWVEITPGRPVCAATAHTQVEAYDEAGKASNRGPVWLYKMELIDTLAKRDSPTVKLPPPPPPKQKGT